MSSYVHVMIHRRVERVNQGPSKGNKNVAVMKKDFV